MTRVVYVDCTREPKGRIGDYISSITKEKDLNRVGFARACRRERESASQLRMLPKLICNYRLRVSIVSQSLIRMTNREPTRGVFLRTANWFFLKLCPIFYDIIS